MRKILLMDRGGSSIRNFKKSLADKGYLLIKSPDLKDAIHHLKGREIDLITIDSQIALKTNGSKRFKQLSAGIPRIILTHDKSTLQPKDSLAISISEPVSFRDYRYWAERLLKETAIAKENSQLQAKLKRREKEMDFYSDIVRNFITATDIRKGLNGILEKIRKITAAKACSLLLNNEPLIEIIGFRASKKINKCTFNRGVGIAGWVLDKGVPVMANEVLKDKRFHKKIDSFPGVKIRSIICAPIKIKDRVIGVLRVINKNDNGHFTDDDLTLVVNTADHMAIAIERAFLYEKLKNDELTNLFNARHLNQAIEMEIERALRYNSAFSLIFIDIDNFKKVNDRHGHLVGSRVLVEIAQLFQKNLRKVDIISRYGGDEFVIILPQTSQESSFLVAERLRKLIEKNIFLKHEGLQIRLTASLGVASFPDNAKNKDELLKIADHAMYRGKFSTKNIVFAAK